DTSRATPTVTPLAPTSSPATRPTPSLSPFPSPFFPKEKCQGKKERERASNDKENERQGKITHFFPLTASTTSCLIPSSCTSSLSLPSASSSLSHVVPSSAPPSSSLEMMYLKKTCTAAIFRSHSNPLAAAVNDVSSPNLVSIS